MAGDPMEPANWPRMASAPSTAEIIDRFRVALAACDIVAPENIIADGRIHPCDAAGKNGKGDAAYLLYLDGLPAVGLENWRDGKGWEAWRFDTGHAQTPNELRELRTRAQTASARRKDEASQRQAAAQALAERIWSAARPAGDGHPYLARKGVASHGLRTIKGALVVPIHAASGTLHSLQFIGAGGTKAISERRTHRRPVLPDRQCRPGGLYRRGLRHRRQRSRGHRPRSRRCLQCR
jgi:phage/plasmid primase-like uncharacterized protein